MATSMLTGLNQEVTQQELLTETIILLNNILDKLGRTDATERSIVNLTETTLPTVTTVTTLTSLQNLGSLNRDSSAIPLHMSNAGTMHIYDNIKIS